MTAYLREIDAGDVACTVLLIFNGTCSSPFTDPGSAKALEPMSVPLLGLERARPGEDGKLWIPVVFSPGAHAISSVSFSLDLENKGLTFDSFDGHGDGLPDAVRFPGGRPDLVDTRYDARDDDGEFDLTLAVFDGALAEGVLVEIAVEPLASATWHRVRLARFAQIPAASFGNTAGQAVPGQTLDATLSK